MSRDGVREGKTSGGATGEQAVASPLATPPAAAPTSTAAPTLDRQVEPWVGEFPGLGRVLVAADGSVTVEVDESASAATDSANSPDGSPGEAPVGDTAAALGVDTLATEGHALREQALRYGWGEPLSWVRRGCHLVGGAAVGPADSNSCVLLLGDPHDVAIIVLELANQGWQLLSDRPTPVTWDEARLLAQPREAPLLVAKRRAAKAGVEGAAVRGDTDALAIEVTRAEAPRQVEGAVQLRVRRPDNETFELLTGHERFEAATSLYIGGVLDPTDPPAGEESATTDHDDAAPNLLAEHLRISQLPWARLHLSSKTAAEDTAELLKWWDTVHYSQGGAN